MGGLVVDALSIKPTISENRVCAPTRSTRTCTTLDKLWLPAITTPPALRDTGRDSPVSSASSTWVSPCKTTPSAGNVCPGKTRITSPTCKRRTATGSNVPSAHWRAMLSGKRFISASSAPAVRSRKRSSSQRPANKKKTNMVSESKYTSFPKVPCGSNVPTVLTTKVISMPTATGKSMLTRLFSTSRQALLKNGPHENNITGSVNTQEAQRSNCSISAVKSPGAAT